MAEMDWPGADRRWTTGEIVDECKDVIDQVLTLAGNPGGVLPGQVEMDELMVEDEA